MIIVNVNKVYYYNGDRMDIPNKDTLYFVIFDVVFELMPDGGFKKYKVIETELEKRRVRGRKIDKLTGEAAATRIRTNLTSEKNGFFRYIKIPNSATMGHPLIKTKKGEGIIFTNK